MEIFKEDYEIYKPQGDSYVFISLDFIEPLDVSSNYHNDIKGMKALRLTTYLSLETRQMSSPEIITVNQANGFEFEYKMSLAEVCFKDEKIQTNFKDIFIKKIRQIVVELKLGGNK